MKRKRNGRPVRWQGKVVGTVEGQTFRKTVCREKHFFRKHHGYGIQADVLGELLQRGVQRIEIYERDTGDVYRTTLKNYLTLGVPVDAGFGKQTVLDLQYFDKSESPQLALF